ncbi:DUF1064 domain-containing protein [Chitinophaga sp. GCM10012297]|uniref:DUF1064 domain-containing protein n=1 Tax=Chitinophaga chungangae TaxID=2821488 RepID=A0ABS3YBQ8_9BACT|nr:DUF1064 domain-containing protein [Chitinophaga chungangae]MBO9151900.1 DUF1064 domain-containing protein [Chitinophaga chungangae]
MSKKQTRFTTEYLAKTACASLNPHLFDQPEEKKKKKSKYGNKKTEINGIEFDSIREAKRYKHLLFLQKIGEIAFLKLQVPYELNPGGTHSLIYIADFVYMEAKTGEWVVEDSKGMRTAVYRKKRRLMKKVHGITIKET